MRWCRTATVFFVPADQAQVLEILSRAIERDVVASAGNVYHTHQKVGSTDVYFLFNNLEEKRLISFDLRIAGAPEVWDRLQRESPAAAPFRGPRRAHPGPVGHGTL